MLSGMAKKNPSRRTKPAKSGAPGPRCGLCGKSDGLTRTACCNQWICDDEHEYVMFSFARNSCARNHDRYTLCAFHHNEGHEGSWQDCEACRDQFETEMFVWYGTNEFNFEKLPNPPAFEPTLCSRCKRVIRLGADGYSIRGDDYYCESCTGLELAKSRRGARRAAG